MQVFYFLLINDLRKAQDEIFKESKVLTYKIDKYKHLSMRQDWNDARIDVMILALRAKFSQDQKLKALLKSTGKALLVEDSPKDAFWGIGLKKDCIIKIK